MYSLNKLVWALVNPAVIGVLMLFFGFLLSRRNIGRVLVFFSLVWFVFWTLPATTDMIGAPLEEPYLVDGAIPSVESYTNADAIVILGGGMSFYKDSKDVYTAEMNANADRVWMGAKLFKAEKAPKIVLTSKHVAESTVPLLKEMDVDESCIEIHEGPRNTEEEARLLATNGVKSVLLVTSAWHMRRSELMFRRYAQEITVIPAPTDWEFSIRKRSWDDESGFGYLKCYQPEAESFWRNTVAFKEWLGYFGYRVFR